MGYFIFFLPPCTLPYALKKCFYKNHLNYYLSKGTKFHCDSDKMKVLGQNNLLGDAPPPGLFRVKGIIIYISLHLYQ